MTLFFFLALPPSGGRANVSLDDERLQDDVPKGLQKVELDLDDSLFLEFEEEEKKSDPPPAPTPQEAPVVPQTAPAAPGKKKWLLAMLVILVCLALGGGGAFFFLNNSSRNETAPAEPVAQPEPTPAHEPAPEKKSDKAAKPRLVPVPAFYFDQFQVEHMDNGKVRLLSCRISVAGINQEGYRETEDNLVPIRDGIYLYLKDSPLTFLTNTKNIDVFGRDILKIINSHLTQGRYLALRFDEYVVQ